MDLSHTFYLVAGANGFIGRSFIRYVTDRNAKVVGFDRTEASWQQDDFTRTPSGSVKLFVGDHGTHAEEIAKAVAESSCAKAVAVNLAGISSVAKCAAQPGEAYFANAQFAFEFAQFCARMGFSAYVYPSTCHAYGASGSEDFRESDPVVPSNAYVNSKIAGEAILRGCSFGDATELIVVRLSNVYGRESPQETIFGTLLKQARHHVPLHVSDVGPIRDFIHVDDVVQAIMRLTALRHGEARGTYNVSTRVPTTVGQLAELFARSTGLPYELSEQKSNDASRIVLDNSRLAEKAGWVPGIDLANGIEMCL